MQSQNNKIESKRPITERVIDLLRFPLIVGVLFIHGVNKAFSNVPDERSFDVSPFYNFFSKMFSEILTASAVPTFFLISGFLFFYKVDSFGKGEYISKLRSRFGTLLIPYLFWNLLSFSIMNLVIQYPSLNNIFHINCFKGSENLLVCLTMPLAGQFWFIRDLMVVVVLSPIVNWIVTRTRHIGIILIFGIWLSEGHLFNDSFQFFKVTSLLFFTAGAWCAYNKGNLHWIGRDFKYAWILWLVVALVLYVVPNGWWNLWLMQTTIILGVVSYMAIGVYVCVRWNLNGGGVLAASSFFIFAAHVHYIQSPIRKIVVAILKPTGDWEFVLVYFGHILLSVVVGVLIYKVLSVLTPRSLAFVTGGRVHKCNNTAINS